MKIVGSSNPKKAVQYIIQEGEKELAEHEKKREERRKQLMKEIKDGEKRSKQLTKEIEDLETQIANSDLR